MFKHIPKNKLDFMAQIDELYRNDECKDKVDLCFGKYMDNKGQPLVLPVVRKVEAEMLKANLDHEYPPVEGDMVYVTEA